jgi:hypothetical protein
MDVNELPQDERIRLEATHEKRLRDIVVKHCVKPLKEAMAHQVCSPSRNVLTLLQGQTINVPYMGQQQLSVVVDLEGKCSFTKVLCFITGLVAGFGPWKRAGVFASCRMTLCCGEVHISQRVPVQSQAKALFAQRLKSPMCPP